MLQLQRGRVYRTRDFAQWDSNPSRLVARLVDQGRLNRLRHGLYHCPSMGVFGVVPPSEDALLKGYFGRRPFLRTGPTLWNGLGLGATAVEAVPLVYNTKVTGEIDLGGRRFEFRRVRFPRTPPQEYFVVDLLKESGRAGADRERILELLVAALREERFDTGRLLDMANRFAGKGVQTRVKAAVHLAAG